jgi:hypothetical protein
MMNKNTTALAYGAFYATIYATLAITAIYGFWPQLHVRAASWLTPLISADGGPRVVDSPVVGRGVSAMNGCHRLRLEFGRIGVIIRE